MRSIQTALKKGMDARLKLSTWWKRGKKQNQVMSQIIRHCTKALGTNAGRQKWHGSMKCVQKEKEWILERKQIKHKNIRELTGQKTCTPTGCIKSKEVSLYREQ